MPLSSILKWKTYSDMINVFLLSDEWCHILSVVCCLPKTDGLFIALLFQFNKMLFYKLPIVIQARLLNDSYEMGPLDAMLASMWHYISKILWNET